MPPFSSIQFRPTGKEQAYLKQQHVDIVCEARLSFQEL